eukprot:15979597-Heterocapsa_arctica.AAC.1
MRAGAPSPACPHLAMKPPKLMRARAPSPAARIHHATRRSYATARPPAVAVLAREPWTRQLREALRLLPPLPPSRPALL